MKIKYPRSWHLPYSEKSSDDDRKHTNDMHFDGKQVVVTIKMDGENTTIYNDHIHARSINSLVDSEDRRWIDNFRKLKIKDNIPNSFRICGENLFYKHTCYYTNLESMFYAFSIWDDNKCLSWEETKIWCDLLEIKMVPVLYEGIYDKKIIIDLFNKYLDQDAEGFVIRTSDEFNINEFNSSLSKYVRKTFSIPDRHWKYSKKIMNKLKNNQDVWLTF